MSKIVTSDLPRSITIVIVELEDSIVAHALDFDLLCEAKTEPEAMERLLATMKTYVEFGISRGWNADLVHHAPAQFWEAARQAPSVKAPATLKVNENPLLLFQAMLNGLTGTNQAAYCH
jgi:hypothetical protein